MSASNLKIVEPDKKDQHIFRLAISPPQHIVQPPLLHVWDVRKPLSEIIKEVTDHYGITNADEYGIQIPEQGEDRYITEETRANVKNGLILKLTTAPWKEAKDIFSALKSGSAGHRSDALEKLSISAKDTSFGAEFVKLKGVEFLISRIEEGKEKGDELCWLLSGMCALMKNGQIASGALNPTVLKKVSTYINPSNTKVTRVSLSILVNVVMNCPDHFLTVANEVTLLLLLPYLDSTDSGVQQECLSLINALCLKATEEKKKRFQESIASRELRVALHEKIVRAPVIQADMAHSLYVFQQLCFNLLHQRCITKVDQNSEIDQEMISNLRKNAFATENDNKKPSMVVDDWKKLGFLNPLDPAKDFENTPPGVLALQCWSYLSNQHTESYTQMVHDNLGRGEEYQCPFAKACIAVTESICKILTVGGEPDSSSTNYHPMFFAQDESFEEFFYHCIKLFHKTWKEMKACNIDFPKVMSVVEEQIREALALQPMSLDQFWNQVHTRFAYANIKEMRKLKRISQDENNSKAQAVLDLKQQLTSDVMELIKQQRLNFLVKGGKLINRSVKNKLAQYFQLSRNHKVLHYGEIRDSTSIPSFESLKEKISVSEITNVAAGKYQTTGRVPSSKNLFHIEYKDKKLELCSESVEDMSMWIDGFTILLGEEPSSHQARLDVEYLLGIEMSIHLLDTANLIIPQEPPPIPPPPSDFNFCTD